MYSTCWDELSIKKWVVGIQGTVLDPEQIYQITWEIMLLIPLCSNSKNYIELQKVDSFFDHFPDLQSKVVNKTSRFLLLNFHCD
jgi:hypothetical protein